jgi:hypothetical protein
MDLLGGIFFGLDITIKLQVDASRWNRLILDSEHHLETLIKTYDLRRGDFFRSRHVVQVCSVARCEWIV